MKIVTIQISVLLLIMLLATGCSNGDTNEDKWSLDIDEVIVLEFEELGESEYDMDALIKHRRLKEDVSFLHLEEVPYQANLEEFEEEGKFTYTENFDFDNCYMLIAYGRKILELECLQSNYIRNHYGSRWYCLSVTFGEDYYDNTVFFYRITKDHSIIRTHYELFTYVMEGTEKVRVDLYSINKPESSEETGNGL